MLGIKCFVLEKDTASTSSVSKRTEVKMEYQSWILDRDRLQSSADILLSSMSSSIDCRLIDPSRKDLPV